MEEEDEDEDGRDRALAEDQQQEKGMGNCQEEEEQEEVEEDKGCQQVVDQEQGQEQGQEVEEDQLWVLDHKDSNRSMLTGGGATVTIAIRAVSPDSTCCILKVPRKNDNKIDSS